MLINVNSKKQIEGQKPIFDFQGPTEITFKLNQDLSNFSAFYLAGSRVYKDSSKILFFSSDYSINEDEITFTVDTYTRNYLDYISEYKTPINLQLASTVDSKHIFLLDKVFANPRVYIGGDLPSGDLGEYYTKEEADAIFLSKLSASNLYYTKEESDQRYLGGEISGYLKLDDPQPISGNLVVNGNTSTETLTINGNPFDPSDYATYNDLSSYLPLSGGNIDELTINNVRAATIQDLEDYMPISGGAFEGEVELPSAIVSSLIQNGVDYQLSGLAQDYVLSSFTSTTLTPQSNIFYHSASALASLTLTIPTGVRNTFIFFETGSTFSATITLDSSLFVNEEMVFDANKAYLIAIERDCVLWTEMIQ